MNDNRRLVIFHTSDVHSRSGFGKAVAALVEPQALLVDCGDALRGSSTVYTRNEPVAAEFACAPYAAQAVGNREFHYVHRWFLERARMLPMPMICSNLLDLRGRTPPFARELLLERNGVSIRLLAALVPQYRTGSGWERIFGWRFLAPEIALAELLRETNRPNAADVTILLSHLGLEADRALAAEFGQLTAIIGGHTHAALHEAEVVNGIPIVHAGAFARYLGRLELAVPGGTTNAGLPSFRLLPLLGGGGPQR